MPEAGGRMRSRRVRLHPLAGVRKPARGKNPRQDRLRVIDSSGGVRTARRINPEVEVDVRDRPCHRNRVANSHQRLILRELKDRGGRLTKRQVGGRRRKHRSSLRAGARLRRAESHERRRDDDPTRSRGPSILPRLAASRGSRDGGNGAANVDGDVAGLARRKTARARGPLAECRR